jgi:hypothetical protein
VTRLDVLERHRGRLYRRIFGMLNGPPKWQGAPQKILRQEVWRNAGVPARPEGQKDGAGSSLKRLRPGQGITFRGYFKAVNQLTAQWIKEFSNDSAAIVTTPYPGRGESRQMSGVGALPCQLLCWPLNWGPPRPPICGPTWLNESIRGRVDALFHGGTAMKTAIVLAACWLRSILVGCADYRSSGHNSDSYRNEGYCSGKPDTLRGGRGRGPLRCLQVGAAAGAPASPVKRTGACSV